MIEDASKPVSEKGAKVLVSLAQPLIGQRLVQARYGWLPGRPDEVEAFSCITHEADMHVALVLEKAEAVISWEMDGLDQGLAVRVSSRASENSGDHGELDVTESPQWSRLVGGGLTEIATAWHVAFASGPRTLWSIRFSFGPRESVTIALGEIDDCAVRYHPTGLVVLFDEAEAHSYGPPGAEAAFGTVLVDRNVRAKSDP